MKEFIYKGLISVGYVGYFPIASGTVGSLVALLFYLLAFYLIDNPLKIYFIGAIGTIISTPICLWLGKWAENYYRKKDPSYFVLDEFAGFFVAVFMIDISKHTVIIVPFIFVVYRILDMVKPYPANVSERLPGGLGIVLDDLIVGVYTNLLAQMLLYWIL
jgi:phosphatidylglycerophosphatase A